MLRELLPLRCLLVKPAGPDCNCRCAYCFYRAKAKLFPAARHRMSKARLDGLLRNALSGGEGDFSFIWQGGEPTLLGLPFYRMAVERQLHYAPQRTITNALQTNGLLIDAAWADFLAKHGFLVGLSLDGPEELHDRYRRVSATKGTWRAVMAAARRLRRAGAMTNALCCVTRESEGRAAELYAFFREEGFTHLQCIPIRELDERGEARPFSVTAEGYGAFLVGLFDAWRRDAPERRLHIRQFETLQVQLAGWGAPECGALETCGVYLAVEHNGDVYPCDFFVSPAHRLGDIAEHSVADLFNSPRQRRFGGAKSRLPESCAQCEWLALCRGGCLKYREFPASDRALSAPEPAMPHYVFCSAMKRFWSHALRDTPLAGAQPPGRQGRKCSEILS